MIKNIASLISLAGVCSGSLALSPQSVEAKAPRISAHTAKNYFVPPPPPYTPSMASWALGMMPPQPVTVDANGAVVQTLVNPYSKYMYTHVQGNLPQVVQPSPYVSHTQGAETKILKQIDSFDTEITSHEKEIGELLNL